MIHETFRMMIFRIFLLSSVVIIIKYNIFFESLFHINGILSSYGQTYKHWNIQISSNKKSNFLFSSPCFQNYLLFFCFNVIFCAFYSIQRFQDLNFCNRSQNLKIICKLIASKLLQFALTCEVFRHGVTDVVSHASAYCLV